jgi:hypothetical protein
MLKTTNRKEPFKVQSFSVYQQTVIQRRFYDFDVNLGVNYFTVRAGLISFSFCFSRYGLEFTYSWL